MKRQIQGYELTCERCGHVWQSFEENPIRCAKCKTPYWNKPKKEKVKPGVQARQK